MRRLIAILGTVLVLLTPSASDAGKHPHALVLVHAAPYSTSVGSCAALEAMVTDCGSAAAQVGTSETDVLIGVYVFQDAALDPAPQEPGDPGLHLLGIDWGIHYDTADLSLAWTLCGDLDLPTDGVNPEGSPYPAWPLPGSGNSVVWVEVQRGEVVLVGFFRATVYGPGTLTISGHPVTQWGLQVLDDELYFDPVSAAGYAGLGGAVGMNPCPTPVKNTSWGRIKSQYGR